MYAGPLHRPAACLQRKGIMARIYRRCEMMGCFTGNPETKAAVREGDTCQTQMKSQAVRQNPQQMQVLMRGLRLCANI